MIIVLTGGGSGGHITPLLAVAHELKQQAPDCRTIYIGSSGDTLGDIPATSPDIDEVYSVRAGKFRRYHGEGWRQLLDIKTLLKNIRDAGWVLVGLVQSWWRLYRLRPDVVFVKGGFVGVPVGLAAAGLRIPFVTHDSDAIPGLANRLIARWATVHAVALPKETYAYPPAKTVTVGVPVAAEYRLVNPARQARLRGELGLEASQPMLFITGGGLGAQRLNQALEKVAGRLLAAYPKLVIAVATGRQHEAAARRFYVTHLEPAQLKRIIIKGYVEDLYRYSGAADVIVARAGGTSLAEFAGQGKACIIVPNPALTAGHQSKNAELLATQGAAIVLSETQLAANAASLYEAIAQLFDSAATRQQLGRHLHTLARPAAASELAQLVLQTARPRTKNSN